RTGTLHAWGCRTHDRPARSWCGVIGLALGRAGGYLSPSSAHPRWALPLTSPTTSSTGRCANERAVVGPPPHATPPLQAASRFPRRQLPGRRLVDGGDDDCDLTDARAARERAARRGRPVPGSTPLPRTDAVRLRRVAEAGRGGGRERPALAGPLPCPG